MKRSHSPDITTNGSKREVKGGSRWSSDEEDFADDHLKHHNEQLVTAPESSPSVTYKVNPEESVDEELLAATTPSEGNLHADLSPARVKFIHNPLFHGCRSVENYQRLNYISAGTYGVVFRAQDKNNGDIVALKQIKFDKTESKLGEHIY